MTQFQFVALPDNAVVFAPNGPNVTLSGRGVSVCDSSPAFSGKNIVGDISIVITLYAGDCWSSSSYSSGQFPIQPGSVNIGGNILSAYQISPALDPRPMGAGMQATMHCM